jgi:transcriptional regulator with XRE-family HTH domain
VPEARGTRTDRDSDFKPGAQSVAIDDQHFPERLAQIVRTILHGQASHVSVVPQYNNMCYTLSMSGADLRDARREREWTQAELADRLGVTQAYVCLLERNRRAVPRRLAQKLASVLKLSPNTLPMSAGRTSLKPDEAASALGAVGYPGFAYLRNRRSLNPADLLLRVLRAGDVDARVVEALPWVLLKYPDLDWTSLLREAKADDLQNRLGFLVSVARQLAELRGETGTAKRLAEREQTLEGSRLQGEGAFRESLTDAERRWLRENRPPHAAFWNMLSTVNAPELANAF